CPTRRRPRMSSRRSRSWTARASPTRGKQATEVRASGVERESLLRNGGRAERPPVSCLVVQVAVQCVANELGALDAAIVGGEALVGDVHICQPAYVSREVASVTGGCSRDAA